MLEKDSQVIKYPIGCLISEINSCYGCFVNYLLDSMDEQYQVTDLVVKSAVECFCRNVEVGLEQIVNGKNLS